MLVFWGCNLINHARFVQRFLFVCDECHPTIGWSMKVCSTTGFCDISHSIHGIGICTYIYHKNQPNAGKYTIYRYIVWIYVLFMLFHVRHIGKKQKTCWVLQWWLPPIMPPPCRYLEDHPSGSKWLITMVIVSPLTRVIPLPNGLNGL